ncbi:MULTISPECIES: Ig-like domain-containing protein [Flavobacterium]|uniref:Ig-like domain-containing protein n=1 Tax=Flavobacterium keumense TaxID=1306518 RepID=A0ABY8N940_9FLAO|nr:MULTISPECIES: Ig-like domain-containing protein [Flavobacterium]WGK95371.1 Ig-like domain-containing protein [Flavobacterium keumense]
MGKTLLKYSAALLLVILASCAKRGNITGGAKDTIAPVLNASFPKNFSTEFKGNTIKLTFDEFIKLKDLKKQLIISPPLKNDPLISPQTPTKTITIKINDTLQNNTTYSFNFGQSIADNNEGNPYNQFKYVFSTGKHIDSLAISGKVKDAYFKDVESFVSVMLYDVNKNFNDSIVYKQMPRYITNTLDSLKTFRLENLQAGKYLLVAMKDYNSNNKFDPKKDKIGFYKQFISVPNDTVYELELFKENLPFKAFKPTQASGNRLLLGYEGNIKLKENRPKIVLKNKEQLIPSILTQLPKKDSLQVWYKPIKTDSLSIEVTQNDYKKSFTFKVKDQKKDTLNIKIAQQGTLSAKNRFTLESATPLVKFDSTKMSLVDQDVKQVPFTTEYDEFEQLLYLNFQKEADKEYLFKLAAGSVTDLFEKSNTNLEFKINANALENFGNLIVNLQNVKRFPVIVELTNSKGDAIATTYTDKNTSLNFNLLDPAKYTLRAIYDDNKNTIYDPGNFLAKQYAEEVIYFSKEIDVRANWDVVQAFDLSIPYTPEPKKKKVKKKVENKRK